MKKNKLVTKVFLITLLVVSLIWEVADHVEPKELLLTAALILLASLFSKQHQDDDDWAF